MSHFGCPFSGGCVALCSGVMMTGALTLRAGFAAGLTAATCGPRPAGWAGLGCVTALTVRTSGGGTCAASLAACTEASVSCIGGSGAAVQSSPNTTLLPATSSTAQ